MKTLENILTDMITLTCVKCGEKMIGNEKDIQGESLCSDCWIFPNGKPKINSDITNKLRESIMRL